MNRPNFRLSLTGDLGRIVGKDDAAFIMGGASGNTLYQVEKATFPETVLNPDTDWIDNKSFDLTKFECLVSATGDSLSPASDDLDTWLPLGAADYRWEILWISGDTKVADLTVTVREIANNRNSAEGVYRITAQEEFTP